VESHLVTFALPGLMPTNTTFTSKTKRPNYRPKSVRNPSELEIRTNRGKASEMEYLKDGENITFTCMGMRHSTVTLLQLIHNESKPTHIRAGFLQTTPPASSRIYTSVYPLAVALVRAGVFIWGKKRAASD
jgi:hypothetical protein